MLERLQEIEARYRELEGELLSPRVWSDPELAARLGRERAELEPVVTAYRHRRELEAQRSALEPLLADSDATLRAMAEEERAVLDAALEASQAEIKRLLLPSDPVDGKNVIVEVRSGAGGEEAALFAQELWRMYVRYAERRGWRWEELSLSATELGGVREVVFAIAGRGAFSRLKYESGVHRVQRVPATESQGRIHTSTATVAVLPEAEEVDVVIQPEDLKVDTFRSGGAGGQHVNKTESAVRITHLPTQMVVICQDERSQLKNRERAMRVLRARLLDHYARKAAEEQAHARRSQVGTGDRSERIRTYNFPQGRVTDHRVGFTTHRLAQVLDGDLDEIIDAVSVSREAQRLGEAAL